MRRHDQLIKDAGWRLAKKGCDVIILAQITMARAADSMLEIKVPVLTSPNEGIRALQNAIREKVKTARGGAQQEICNEGEWK